MHLAYYVHQHLFRKPLGSHFYVIQFSSAVRDISSLPLPHTNVPIFLPSDMFENIQLKIIN